MTGAAARRVSALSPRPPLSSSPPPHTFLQLITMGAKDFTSISMPETLSRHLVTPCVDALGLTSTPALVYQGSRATSRFFQEFTKMLLGADSTGRVSCELFLAWCCKWEAVHVASTGAFALSFSTGVSRTRPPQAPFILCKCDAITIPLRPRTTLCICALEIELSGHFHAVCLSKARRNARVGRVGAKKNTRFCARDRWVDDCSISGPQSDAVRRRPTRI